MKPTLIIVQVVLLLATFVAGSNAAKEGFLDFEWGTSVAKIDSAASLTYLGHNESFEGRPCYEHLKQYRPNISTFLGIQIDSCVIEFYKDQLWSVLVKKYVGSNSHEAKTVLTNMKNIYGEPKEEPLISIWQWDLSRSLILYAIRENTTLVIMMFSTDISHMIERDDKANAGQQGR